MFLNLLTSALPFTLHDSEGFLFFTDTPPPCSSTFDSAAFWFTLSFIFF